MLSEAVCTIIGPTDSGAFSSSPAGGAGAGASHASELAVSAGGLAGDWNVRAPKARLSVGGADKSVARGASSHATWRVLKKLGMLTTASNATSPKPANAQTYGLAN